MRRSHHRPAVGGPQLAGILLVLGAALAAAPCAAADRAGRAVRIELRSEVELPGGLVRLGDVADVSGGSAARLGRLRAVALGRLDGVDRPLRIGRAAIRRWLRLREGIEPDGIAWAGAERCEVRRASQRVDGDRVAAAAVDRAVALLRGRGLRAEVRAAQPAGALRLPAGEIHLTVRDLPRLLAVSRRASAWVDVEVGGRPVLAVPVLLELEVRGPAAVAVEPLAPGTRLAPGLVELREVDWTGRSAEPLPFAAADGARLRRAVGKDEPVTADAADAAPLVSRGGRATLRAREGAVEVEGRVEVLQDGFSGQAVAVRLPGARGPIVARVVGPDAVEMLP
jgi:flagella basal body P-ring formation protein FlgA